MSSKYCASRFRTIRNATREVMVGNVGVGGNNPIRIQSMTITDTLDVEATVRQTIELAEAGCEIVRITAPNVRAAEALGPIARQVRATGIEVPLVADIHFLPQAAMEATKHVEKVRVNPGNYADSKKFAVREYSDEEYDAELERLHDSFSPLVLRCKELGRSMRIGTNHGSLSDRILNRYGDTPRGMAESALEFVRIAESQGFRDLILSMKASNPKVMVEAYRLVVALMNEEGMDYPLHLGVTEAGEGEDARIKSAVGIGSLLLDGLGDTIRVSLTEDPVHEIPVARDLAARTEQLWNGKGTDEWDEGIDPFTFDRRNCNGIELSGTCKMGPKEPPRVIVPAGRSLSEFREIVYDLSRIQVANEDAPIEGLLLQFESTEDLVPLATLRE
ncbi:MAG: (E)-4-hydroxy-3-methylbut-2-enyl-diphosphate synthase, partial [Opitutales bacterium]